MECKLSVLRTPLLNDKIRITNDELNDENLSTRSQKIGHLRIGNFILKFGFRICEVSF
jgi:hypothetical protein